MLNMLQKWICNKCGFETTEKPSNKNSICPHCGKGRFQGFNFCLCGKWFHPDRLSQKYCSKKCGYLFKKNGGKKGKHYPNTQRARKANCPICGKEFRAVADFKGRKQIYCCHDCYMKSRLETTPEMKVRFFLDSVGAKYIQEYKIGRFWADFYLIDYNSVIEVDGDYWHSLPEIKEKDKRKDAFLIEKGIRVFHIKECELKTNDVIIQRWQNLTGKEAVRADGVKYNDL